MSNRKSNIEIASDEFWIYCTYDEAVPYCFQLVIDGKAGWRLPTRKEFHEYAIFPGRSWYQNDARNYGRPYRIVPVRDIT